MIEEQKPNDLKTVNIYYPYVVLCRVCLSFPQQQLDN